MPRYLGVAPLRDALPAEEVATRCSCGVSAFLQAEGAQWGSADSSVLQRTPMGLGHSPGEYTYNLRACQSTSSPLHTFGGTDCGAAATPSWLAASA